MILNHQLTLNKTLSGECVEICQRGKTFDPVIALRWNTVTGSHKMDLAFDERARSCVADERTCMREETWRAACAWVRECRCGPTCITCTGGSVSHSGRHAVSL